MPELNDVTFNLNYFCTNFNTISKHFSYYLFFYSDCPDKFINIYGRRCIHFLTQSGGTWMEMKQRCNAMAGRLLQLDDIMLKIAITDYIKGHEGKLILIGGQDKLTCDIT